MENDAPEFLAPLPSRVISNRRVGPGWFVLRLQEPTIAQRARPGQFVQILCADDEAVDPLLRRPFSVYCVDESNDTYDVLYTTVGRGTRWMASIPESGHSADGGEPIEVDVLGPLGNTFSAPSSDERIYLVGGGVGVAPLYFFARRLLEWENPPSITFCMGARSRDLLQGADEFRALAVRTEVATDDGSEGFHGRVTGLFESLLERDAAAGVTGKIRVYGCGPQGMNEALRALTTAAELDCEICLESLMGCGFGICFGCVAPIRRTPEEDYANRRICFEGPVFDARCLHPGIEGCVAASGEAV